MASFVPVFPSLPFAPKIGGGEVLKGTQESCFLPHHYIDSGFKDPRQSSSEKGAGMAWDEGSFGITKSEERFSSRSY